MTIRRAKRADNDQIAAVCLLTGAQGRDATGLFGDDTALSDVYATPYLFGPTCFCFVWDVEGVARGYVLGAADTEEFQEWFVEEWWPSRSPLHEVRTEADAWLLPSAADPRRMIIPALDEYPAHLHIDLLPDQQGRGGGRQLIEAAAEFLHGEGVPGVHLVAERANAGAQAFYPRVGFEAIDADDTLVTWARRL